MRRRTAAAVLLVPMLAGCAHGSAPAGHPVQLVGQVETLRPGTMTAADISTAQRRFALDLLHQVCGKTGPDTLVAPASAFDALGMLAAASGGSTTTAVAGLLHLPAWNPTVVAAVRDQQAALAPLSAGTGDTLRTSDRVWPDVTVRPTQHFLDDVQTAYGASLRSLDYTQQPAATDAINRQVSLDTDGLIPTLFDQPLAKTTKAVLTDAVVLKATWLTPFLKDSSPTPFTSPAGGRQVTQMHSMSFAGYSAAQGWQAAHIAYTSGTLEAVVMLPPKGGACAAPSSLAFDVLATTSSGTATVTMPALHLAQTHPLLDTLQAMGLPVHGDYHGLGSSVITDVVQKDVMTVDELGTTAAGATGIAMAAASESATGTVHALVFDRPYLLLLQDTATHTPLFLASVGDPDAS